MDPRINMVMVSAKDIHALRAFYEQGLGWAPWMPASEGSVAYKVGTSVLIFVDATYLAHESGIATVDAPKAIWAVFVPTRKDVDAAFELAVKAGPRSPVRSGIEIKVCIRGTSPIPRAMAGKWCGARTCRLARMVR